MSKMIDVHQLIFEADASSDSFATTMASQTALELQDKLNQYGIGLEDAALEELTAVIHHYVKGTGQHDSN